MQVLIGILASDIRLAVRSLKDFTAALGTPFVMPESRVRFRPLLIELLPSVLGSSLHLDFSSSPQGPGLQALSKISELCYPS